MRGPVTFFHYRDSRRGEVDLVLEAPDGRVACVEVKTSHTAGARDLRTLQFIRDKMGKAFVQGMVLNLADQVQPLGERLTMMPLESLWT